MASLDFISGRHCVAKIYFNGGLWAIKAKTIRLQELSTEITDQVCGERRARFQKITDGYRVTVDCFEDGNSAILANYITNQSNEDAYLAQLPLAGGLLFKFLDGTKQGVTIKGNSCLGPLDLNIGGRTERVAHSVQFRSQDVSLVATA